MIVGGWAGRSERRLFEWHPALSLPVFLIFLLTVSCANHAHAQSAPMGFSQSRDKLLQRVSVQFVRQPFREAFRRVSEGYGIPILIDRRVDPDQLVDLTVKDLPLAELLRQLAAAGQADIVWVGSLGYIGSSDKAWQMLGICDISGQIVRRLPPGSRKVWEAQRAFSWPDFSTPRELLMQLAQDAAISFDNLDTVPHDLWAGAKLPPLPLYCRIALVTGQFDLAPVITPEQRPVELRPVEPPLRWERVYPAMGPQGGGILSAIKKVASDAKIRESRDQIFVFGTTEDHRAVERLFWEKTISVAPRPPKSLPPAWENRRFTVRQGSGRLASVLAQLANGLGLQLKLDPQELAKAGVQPDRQLSFSVENATLDELLRAVLEPVGCTYRLQGDILEIIPQER